MNTLALAPIPSQGPVNQGHGPGGLPVGGLRNPILPNQLQASSGLQYLQRILPNLIGLLFVVGAIIFLFMMLIGGIQWISSGGDKGKIEAARGKITSALIGLFIMLAVYAIIKLIESFFGVSILTLDIGLLIIR